jgi:hypothetical protein
MRGAWAAAALSGALLSLALTAASGEAEVSQERGVRVAVRGKLSPSRLPRRGQAPVAVSVSGRIGSYGAAALPQLERMTIAINRAGRLESAGIPRCRVGQIQPSNDRQALEACRRSLIGEGSFSADVRLPEQSPFPSVGRVLAFNGTIGGRPAILAHIYGTKPLPTSYVLPFRVRSVKGIFGTQLEAVFPRLTGEWGFVTGISLRLDRSRFLSAGCPAPSGFGGAVFPLIRTSFAFAGGIDLTNTLTRSCKVAR